MRATRCAPTVRLHSDMAAHALTLEQTVRHVLDASLPPDAVLNDEAALFVRNLDEGWLPVYRAGIVGGGFGLVFDELQDF